MSIIEPMQDRAAFKERARKSWSENTRYWLEGPLRHVVDVGERIVERLDHVLPEDGNVLDMGFGDGWLLRALRQRGFVGRYVGVDLNPSFVDSAKRRFSTDQAAEFFVGDFEGALPEEFASSFDVVTNCFNFFELADLSTGFRYVRSALVRDGKLVMTTIEPVYLIAAISHSLTEFLSLLRQNREGPHPNYFFQPIDLGDRASEDLEYPSVLHSVADYFRAGREHELHLAELLQWDYTHRPIPKIYLHLEFTR